MSDNSEIKPTDEIRKLQSFTSPSGRVVEYALDGRCGNGDPVLFHFHGQYINDIGVATVPDVQDVPQTAAAGEWSGRVGFASVENRFHKPRRLWQIDPR